MIEWFRNLLSISTCAATLRLQVWLVRGGGAAVLRGGAVQVIPVASKLPDYALTLNLPKLYDTNPASVQFQCEIDVLELRPLRTNP